MKEIFGLVVCGGESSRMGMDKSLLVYHQKSQSYHMYEMLDLLCDKVFVSCNKKQASAIPDDYEKIIDLELYQNIGPMAALLSAFTKFPDKNFIVVACDYPFLQQEDIRKLIDAIDDKHLAVSYFNPISEMKEPLLAYYSKECFPLLIKYIEKKEYSLRNFLKEIDSNKIEPISQESITSIDTPEAYHKALLRLREINGNKLIHAI